MSNLKAKTAKQEKLFNSVHDFNQAVNEFLQQKAKSTQATYKRYFKMFQEFFQKLDWIISKRALLQYQDHVKQVLPKSVQTAALYSIKSFLQDQEDQELLDTRFSRFIKPPGQPEPLNKRDKINHDVFKELREVCVNEKERAILDLFSRCGLRRNELRHLQGQDFTKVNDNVFSVRVQHGKGDKQRDVLFQPTTAIKNILQAAGSGPLFSGMRIPQCKRKRNEFISPGTLNALMRRLVKKTQHDGQGIDLHSLRHYAATTFYDQSNHDIEATRKFLGHSKCETTSIYLSRGHTGIVLQFDDNDSVKQEIKQEVKQERPKKKAKIEVIDLVSSSESDSE